MMPTPARTILALIPAAALALAAGCETSPPGAGLTNGPAPNADEKPAGRIDLPTADAPPPDVPTGAIEGSNTAGPGVTSGLDRQEAGLIGSDVGATGSEGGTAARGGGRAGAPVAEPRPDGSDAPQAATDAPRDASTSVPGTPPTIQAPADAGAPGGPPPGNIQTGTPRSPRS